MCIEVFLEVISLRDLMIFVLLETKVYENYKKVYLRKKTNSIPIVAVL